MNEELTLVEWLTSTQEKREELDTFGKSALPADAGERHVDMELSIQHSDDAGRLLADAKSYLTQAYAQAMFAARKEHPDLTAKEREIVIEDSVRHVQRLIDGICVTVKTLNNRIYTMMNQNRSKL